MADASPSRPARRSRLQFSLRLLLLGLTAFAIGFPIWYRWPYEETEVIYPRGDQSQKPEGTITRTWQRAWGGGKSQTGRTVKVTANGDIKTIEHYVNGVRNGPFEFYLHGKLNRAGQYNHGKRQGRWIDYGTRTYTAHWHQDLLNGPFVIESRDGRKQAFAFDQGRLREIDGRPFRDRLRDQLRSGAIDFDRVEEELNQVIVVETEFVEAPLIDALQHLQDLHNVPFVLDERHIDDVAQVITLTIKGLDLCSALALFAATHDLAIEYRYGVIYVTMPENARDWRDPTGVAHIRPAPDSNLARAWNEPAPSETIESTLDIELQRLAQRLAIEIDTSRIAPSPEQPQGIPLTACFKGQPFRNTLALLLDKTGCTCRLEGEKLVILPP